MRDNSIRALVHKNVRGLETLPVEKVEGNLESVESLQRAFAGADVVFHAAGRISITRMDARRVFETNVGGTRNVIAACTMVGVSRLVHFSSIEALDLRPLALPVDEERSFAAGPTFSPYTISKAEGEREVRSAIAGGVDAVIINPTAIVGPWDFRHSLLGKAILAFARGAFPILVEGGFDWVDARNVAETAIQAAESARPGSRYIVGGRWASMTKLARLVCEVTGARPPRLMCPFALARI